MGVSKKEKECQKVLLRGFKKAQIDGKMSWYPPIYTTTLVAIVAISVKIKMHLQV